MKKIITISREFGSGGRTIGKHLAEELGIPCYDSEIIEKVALESGFAEEYVKDKGEYTHPSLLMGLLTNRSLYTGPTNEDKIWLIQCKVIKQLAEEGPCVIVGRCADYILRNRDDLMKVFIYADAEARAWIDAIVNDTEQVVKPEQAMVVSEILEAIYVSSETGKPVYFE